MYMAPLCCALSSVSVASTFGAAIWRITMNNSCRNVDIFTRGQNTIRYDARCYFNVRSKADISQLNLPHGTDN